MIQAPYSPLICLSNFAMCVESNLLERHVVALEFYPTSESLTSKRWIDRPIRRKVLFRIQEASACERNKVDSGFKITNRGAQHPNRNLVYLQRRLSGFRMG